MPVHAGRNGACDIAPIQRRTADPSGDLTEEAGTSVASERPPEHCGAEAGLAFGSPQVERTAGHPRVELAHARDLVERAWHVPVERAEAEEDRRVEHHREAPQRDDELGLGRRERCALLRGHELQGDVVVDDEKSDSAAMS